MDTKNHTRSHREEARSAAAQAVTLLAHAFNHCENPGTAYRYDAPTQARFFQLMCELVRLVEEGAIEDLRPARAQADVAFQRFIAEAGVRHE